MAQVYRGDQRIRLWWDDFYGIRICIAARVVALVVRIQIVPIFLLCVVLSSLIVREDKRMMSGRITAAAGVRISVECE